MDKKKLKKYVKILAVILIIYILGYVTLRATRSIFFSNISCLRSYIGPMKYRITAYGNYKTMLMLYYPVAKVEEWYVNHKARNEFKKDWPAISDRLMKDWNEKQKKIKKR